MKKFNIFIKLIPALVLFNGLSFAEVDNLTSEQLIQAQTLGVVVIDIRTPKEWQQVGTIPGSHKIMFYDESRNPKITEFMTEFKKVVTDKNQPFILVCRTGSRTGKATKYLSQKQGYTHAAHLQKGIKQWIVEGREMALK